MKQKLHVITPSCCFSYHFFTILEIHPEQFVDLDKFRNKRMFDVWWRVVSCKFFIYYYAKNSVKNIVLRNQRISVLFPVLKKNLYNWLTIPFFLAVFSFVAFTTIIYMLFHKLYSSRTAVMPLTTVSAFPSGTSGACNLTSL